MSGMLKDLGAIFIGVLPLIFLLDFEHKYEVAVSDMCRFERIEHKREVAKLELLDSFVLKHKIVKEHKNRLPIPELHECGWFD